MKLAGLSLMLVFGSVSLAAQNTPRAGFSTFSVSPLSIGCPVSMRLQQMPGNRVESVQNGSVYKAPATQLMLTVTSAIWSSDGAAHVATPKKPEGKRGNQDTVGSRKPVRIVSAAATAYGYGPRAHAELVSPGGIGNENPAPKRGVLLRFNPRDGSSVAEVMLAGFGAVRWLNVESLTYSNGFIWKPAKGQMCVVSPDPFMLVGAYSGAGLPAR